MGATMWSHLVAIFADLPAPGPTYDGRQLLKACQTTQRAQTLSLSLAAILLPILLGVILLIILSVAGPPGIILSIAISIFALCVVIPIAVVNKTQRVYQNFSSRLNLQQRALLDEASEEYAKYYRSQQQGLYQQQLFQQQLQLQQQQQIQNMLNNINRQY